jgi:anti-sigma-K factor RskA
MNQNSEEILLDLLVKEATEGLTDAERRQLKEMQGGSANKDNSFELTAASLATANLDTSEPLPSHIRARIEDAADEWFQQREAPKFTAPAQPPATSPKMGWFGWLGWAAAAVALVALAITIWSPRKEQPTTGGLTPTPAETPIEVPEKRREELMADAQDIRKATWGAGNVKELASVTGDAVWSDNRQEGYIRFRGLPPNDKHTQQYQLWIFDETQSERTPIDGGVFDVNANGEVVIPIHAALQVRKPKAFAVTIEKPGGVVVSDRSKVVVLGKVETSS